MAPRNERSLCVTGAGRYRRYRSALNGKRSQGWCPRVTGAGGNLISIRELEAVPEAVPEVTLWLYDFFAFRFPSKRKGVELWL